MTNTIALSEMPNLAGRQLEPSQWLEVTQERVFRVAFRDIGCALAKRADKRLEILWLRCAETSKTVQDPLDFEWLARILEHS